VAHIHLTGKLRLSNLANIQQRMTAQFPKALMGEEEQIFLVAFKSPNFSLPFGGHISDRVYI
jgi:hypothetical protein